MLTDSDKALLVAFLDHALTDRQKIGMLAMLETGKVAKRALTDPTVQAHVLDLIAVFSPVKADEIREHLAKRTK